MIETGKMEKKQLEVKTILKNV